MVCIAEQLFVDGVKVTFCRFLMAEDLDDLLAVHHLFDITFDLAEGLLLAEEVFGRSAADVLCHLRHAEDTEEDDEHQRDGEIEHEQQQADNCQSRSKQLRQALRNELAKRIDIICIIAHDVAAAVLVEITDGQLLHPRKHTGAELVQEALRHVGHQLRIDRRAGKPRKIDADHGDERMEDLSAHTVPAEPQAVFNVAGDGFNIDRGQDADDCTDDNADHDCNEHGGVILKQHPDHSAERLEICLCADHRRAGRSSGMISHCPHLPFCSGNNRLPDRSGSRKEASHACPCR